MSNGEPANRRGTVQSVDRALAILEILGRQGWSGVTEIAADLGIHKSTVFRLLTTLERRGMVEQHVRTQKYRLGFALVRLASAVRSALDLTRFARPICERLSDAVGESVTLAVLEGNEVVNVDQVNLSGAVVSADWLGRRTALHTTSNGKVFLAHLPSAVLDEALNGLYPVTPHTVTDPESMREQLEAVRRDGYAYSVEELERGLNAVAAPVRAADGAVLAAVCISGPAFRVTPGRLPDLGKLVIEAADEISRGLGFSAASPE